MPDLIHVYHNNQQEGPYSHDQLREMIANGAVTPVTLAWQEGMSEWAPLNTIISLPATTPAAVPPPPPTEAVQQQSVATPPVAATGPKGVGGHWYSSVSDSRYWPVVFHWPTIDELSKQLVLPSSCFHRHYENADQSRF